MKWLRIVLVVLGIVLAGAAATLFVATRHRTAAAATWPSVQGRITANAIEVVDREGWRRRHRHRHRYLPRLRYAYSVGGRAYSSERIWLARTRSWRLRANAVEAIDDLPVGAAVRVFYDPANPSDSALVVRGVLWPFAIMFLGGIVLIGLGLLLPDKRRRPRAARA